MEDTLKPIAVRILREQEVQKSNQNNLLRGRFGDRLTIALTKECEQRDREIAAINAAIEMIEAA